MLISFLNQPKYVTRRHIIDVRDFPNIKLEIINRPIWVKPFEINILVM